MSYWFFVETVRNSICFTVTGDFFILAGADRINKFCVSKEAAAKRIDTMHKINLDFRSKNKQDFYEWLTIKHSAFFNSVLPQKNSIDWFEDEYEPQRDNWF